jgi:Pyruvate/2-oxoacid:ferredoxin oxidoreductase delta subunit
MACIQWCPQEAIQHKNKTSKRKRYHNPEVSLQEILDQKKRMD